MDDPTPSALRIGVVGSDPVLRDSLAAGLGAAERALALALDHVEEADQAGVDVVLVDLGPAPGRVSLAAGPVPLLAMAADAATGGRALAAGAAGVVGRTADAGSLLPALAAVAAGLLVLAPGWRALLATPGAPAVDSPLSPREQEVLELLAEGLSNKQIGARLFVSANTVRFHVRAILEKLGAASRTEAVVLGARAGLLEL